MKVAEHSVRTPSSHHFDDVGVDTSAEEGHSPTCTKGTGIDIGRVETMRSGGGSDANGGGDKGRGDVGFAGGCVDVVEGRERVGSVRAEVEDAASEGDNGTCKRMAAAPVGQDFATNHVFLGGELELSTGGTP
jgi:hypothetical protein